MLCAITCIGSPNNLGKECRLHQHGRHRHDNSVAEVFNRKEERQVAYDQYNDGRCVGVCHVV